MDVSQFTALLQVLGRIADALERSQMTPEQVGQYIQTIDQQNLRSSRFLEELVSVKLALQGIREELSELNIHPSFEAIQNIASTLDRIRRVGLPVEQG